MNFLNVTFLTRKFLNCYKFLENVWSLAQLVSWNSYIYIQKILWKRVVFIVCADWLLCPKYLLLLPFHNCWKNVPECIAYSTQKLLWLMWKLMFHLKTRLCKKLLVFWYTVEHSVWNEMNFLNVNIAISILILCIRVYHDF